MNAVIMTKASVEGLLTVAIHTFLSNQNIITIGNNPHSLLPYREVPPISLYVAEYFVVGIFTWVE